MRRTVLRSHLHNAFVLLHRRHHPPTFFDVVSVRLFDVHILAGQTAKNCWNGVPVVRRTNDQSIDGRIVDDATEIRVRPRFRVLQISRSLHGFRKPAAIHIGNRHNIR